MKNNFIDISTEGLAALKAFPEEKPIQMVNFLKFKKRVPETGHSGEKQYTIYMKAASKHMAEVDANIVFFGTVKYTIIGPNDELEWDKILIVQYASKLEFFKMVMAKDYPSHLRKLALEDSRLLLCEV